MDCQHPKPAPGEISARYVPEMRLYKISNMYSRRVLYLER